ncbi:phosphate acyltransferase [Dongshaea marina]|uniref:phosphate acyltransferase n=1 Tax=Dongshaea marina TaxID=2047966 RepID=UPI000D3EBA77|nr:phosphate acyltransferase [Dongshaea marina]
MLKSLQTFVELAKAKTGKKIAVAAAEDKTTLQALKRIVEEGIATPILVGDEQKIQQICNEIDFDIRSFQLIDVKVPFKACQKAVELVREGEADVLTRGLLSTPDYLRPILNKEKGLKNARLVSHAAFLEMPTYHKVFAFTDSGINIAPDVNDKALMIQNCVKVFHSVGIDNPKVSVMAATEGVKTAMPSTIDAAILTQMNRRGGIKGCVVDGPLSVDLTFSKESVEHKGMETPVGGDADLILLPDINAANAFYKSCTFLGGAKGASFIMGTMAPIDFPSRSDSIETKFYSMACVVAQTK